MILYMYYLRLAVIGNPKNQGYETCSGSGLTNYRTFDGVDFQFSGKCSYVLFSDGVRTVTITPINCDRCTGCEKVRSMLRKVIG